MRRISRLLCLAALLALPALAFWACSNDKVVQPTSSDVFSGQSIIQSTMGYYHYEYAPDTDLVTFSVSGTEYTMKFLTHNCGLCDMTGSVRGFGTNSMTLTPAGPLTVQCDNRRVPEGEMTTVFRHDSLIVGPVTVGWEINANNTVMYDTSVFFFRFKQQ